MTGKKWEGHEKFSSEEGLVFFPTLLLKWLKPLVYNYCTVLVLKAKINVRLPHWKPWWWLPWLVSNGCDPNK